MGRKTRINEDQIAEIRSSKESGKSLANKFGVTAQTISSVRNFRGAYAAKSPGEFKNTSDQEISSSGDRDTEAKADVRTPSNAEWLKQLFP